MKTKYPFDPAIKHHLIIALGVAFWVFAFLFFTEPLDVSELNHSEKLTYLPLYALVGAFSYCSFIPLQYYLLKKSKQNWKLKHELVFIITLSVISIILARLLYLHVIVRGEPNPYPLLYMIK